MPRSKRGVDEKFSRASTNALGRRSAYALARDAGLPIKSIAQVLEGNDPHLSRAIEVANALGFEIRYEWPRGNEAHRQATRLAVRMMFAMRPEFREILAKPKVWAFAEALIAAREDLARELGPTRTGDPDKTHEQLLRVIEMQKSAQEEREAANE